MTIHTSCLLQTASYCHKQNKYPRIVSVCYSFLCMYSYGRTGLWQLLRKYGCPEKFTAMIEALHTGMMANVSVGGEVSESFSVTNGTSKDVYWPPRCSPSSYQQCSMMLSETWGMAPTYSPDRALTYSTSHTSERRPRLLGY